MTAETHQYKATTAAVGEREIRIEREFDAPRDQVFASDDSTQS